MTRPLSMDIRDRAMARLDANAPRASPGNVVSARPIQQAICDATRSCSIKLRYIGDARREAR